MQNNDKIGKLLKDLQKDPENIFIKKYLAEEYNTIGEYHAAIHYAAEALEKTPEDAELRLLLAQAHADALETENAFHQASLILKNETLDDFTRFCCYTLLERCANVKGDKEGAEMYRQTAADLTKKLEDENIERLVTEVSGEKEQTESAEILAFKKKPLLVSVRDGLDGRDVDAVPFEKADVTFSDVGGLDSLKEEIRLKIIYPFNEPEIYKAYGKPIGGGILLYGPPGCGKTYIAKATAGECCAHFISLGINDLLDMWHGNTEKNIHAVFEAARENAPTILFFDEVEAVGGNRIQMREHHQRVIVNQLLSEMDGIKSLGEKVLVIGATNAPWFVDSALRRPGRFDRVIFVSPPDLKGRMAILNLCLKDRPVRKVDVYKLAQFTEGFSGADLKNLVDTTMEIGIKKAMQTGKVQDLAMEDFVKTLKAVKETTSEWFETAKNYATYSNESGLYDPVVEYLEAVKKLPAGFKAAASKMLQ